MVDCRFGLPDGKFLHNMLQNQSTILESMAVNEDGVLASGGNNGSLWQAPHSALELHEKIYATADASELTPTYSHLLASLVLRLEMRDSSSVQQSGVWYACNEAMIAEGSICRFWDYHSGNRFQDEQTIVQPGSLESEAGINCMSFDVSGSRLITGEVDKTIKCRPLPLSLLTAVSMFSRHGFSSRCQAQHLTTQIIFQELLVEMARGFLNH